MAAFFTEQLAVDVKEGLHRAWPMDGLQRLHRMDMQRNGSIAEVW